MKTIYGLKVSKNGNIYKGLKRLKQIENKSGYLFVKFTYLRKPRKLFSHRLVALCYCRKPKNKKDLCVDHIDCNKQNNNALNLRWVTYDQNFKYAIQNGLIPKGAKNRYKPRKRKSSLLKKVLVYAFK